MEVLLRYQLQLIKKPGQCRVVIHIPGNVWQLPEKEHHVQGRQDRMVTVGNMVGKDWKYNLLNPEVLKRKYPSLIPLISKPITIKI